MGHSRLRTAIRMKKHLTLGATLFLLFPWWTMRTDFREGEVGGADEMKDRLVFRFGRLDAAAARSMSGDEFGILGDRKMQFLEIVSHLTLVGLAGLLVTGSGCATRNPQPPVAKVLPQQMEKHGYVWTDNYHWLWNRKHPEVRQYLEVENQYTAAVMAHTQKLQDKLFEEFKGRIRQTDISVPYKEDGYFSYGRTEAGKDYPIYCRRKGTLDTPEQIILDVNQLAVGHQYCAAWPLVSPDGNLMAYMVDTAGRRFFTIHFTNLQTGEVLKEVIPDVTASVQWANDNKTLFYTKQHPGTLRSHQIYRRTLGTDPAKDELVYEEKDEEYSCFITKTKSNPAAASSLVSFARIPMPTFSATSKSTIHFMPASIPS
jgi:hypothetical protein